MIKLPKPLHELNALRQLALEDLTAQSDAQLRQEASEDGEDVDVLATALRASLRETSAQVLRQRLLEVKRRMAGPAARTATPLAYPALEKLKQRIQRAFEAQPELGLAFRGGKKQSERDWQSLYDDLIELGAIAPDEDES